MQMSDVPLDIYCTAGGRICPAPLSWNGFWKILRERAGEEPPAPFILSAWYGSSDQAKAERLQAQLHWAAEHGLLAEADQFLRSLPANEWHTTDQRW